MQEVAGCWRNLRACSRTGIHTKVWLRVIFVVSAQSKQDCLCTKFAFFQQRCQCFLSGQSLSPLFCTFMSCGCSEKCDQTVAFIPLTWGSWLVGEEHSLCKGAALLANQNSLARHRHASVLCRGPIWNSNYPQWKHSPFSLFSFPLSSLLNINLTNAKPPVGRRTSMQPRLRKLKFCPRRNWTTNVLFITLVSLVSVVNNQNDETVLLHSNERSAG